MTMPWSAAGSAAGSAARVRRLANLINLSTASGLVVARLGQAQVRSGPDGFILAERYRLPFPIAAAFTVGDVLITSSCWDDLAQASPRLMRHEQRHSWQYVVCGGLPFLPLYALAMAWSWLRCRDRFSHNVFERLAGLTDGGYRVAN